MGGVQGCRWAHGASLPMQGDNEKGPSHGARLREDRWVGPRRWGLLGEQPEVRLGRGGL